jgi:hypothetical protein
VDGQNHLAWQARRPDLLKQFKFDFARLPDPVPFPVFYDFPKFA